MFNPFKPKIEVAIKKVGEHSDLPDDRLMKYVEMLVNDHNWQYLEELAMQEAQSQMQQKQRAETAPRDAMMEAMKNAPENSMLKIELNKMLMADCGLMTPELLKAYEIEEAKLHINNDAMARKLGSEVAALGGNDEGMDYEAAGSAEGDEGFAGTGAEGGM